MFHSEIDDSYINFLSSVSGSPKFEMDGSLFDFAIGVITCCVYAAFVVFVILLSCQLNCEKGKFNKILYQHIHDEQTTQHIIYICMSCLESLRLFYLQSLIIVFVFTPE